MATIDRTADYWARIEDALDAQALANARREDQQQLVEALGRDVHEMTARTTHAADTAATLAEMLAPIGDAERATALAAILRDYAVETSNRALDVAARALAALERGKMVAV